ncbi:MAG TPA: adenosylmethionine--8-amino-7-oxononanoate transaminase [Vicinamibacterales bacterium]|nr:adenosylmethionine--8-amino-7-oxononanoate transaminase [Vicinamibacterales bacterium]
MTDPEIREQLIAREKRHIWHPFTQMRDWEADDPLFIASGDGVKVRDIDGREYYDANSSLWVTVHGHNRPEINAAIEAQLHKIAHSTLLGLTHEPAVELAERLVKIVPPGLERVFYSDSGSTAVEIAIKMAYQYWHHVGQERSKFIALSDGYHGDTVGAVSVGGIGLFHGIFRKLLFDCEFAPCPAKAASLADAVEGVEAVLQRDAASVAAIIAEPLIQAAGGMLVAPRGFLAALRALCDRYDVLLIVDEVATGFGRTGRMFACEHEGVTPDLMTVAKGLTGGYLPLAATLATDRVYRAFLGEYGELKTFFHGHSYTGNPLACAAALASLDIFERDKVIDGLAPKIDLVTSILDEIRTLPNVGQISQIGLMVGIEVVASKEPRVEYPFEAAVGARICRRAREMGLITRPLGNMIIFMPMLSATSDELRAMLGIIRAAIVAGVRQA